ncbi:MAG: metallophosphatase family protein [Acidobacteria bacterium]|nr:metallophosphatase family protein [Acidobacteriota bacterium]
MRSLLLSDLHSNREALTAVFRHVARKSLNQLICLGDLVGYGAHPNHVLEMLRRSRRKKFIIRGNHDRVAMGTGDPSDFNNAASTAVLWTRQKLSRSNLTYLQGLPVGPFELSDEVLLCHGSPDDEDEYVMTRPQVSRIFDSWPHRLIFFGHTHLPVVYRFQRGDLRGELIKAPFTVQLEPDCRYLINPGSVGQPRDRDWRTSFAIWDDDRNTVRFFRSEYDVGSTQEAILEAGLPAILSSRLSTGF